MQPGEHGVGPFVRGQVFVQGPQLGTDLAGAVVEQRRQPCPQRATSAPTPAVLAALSAAGAGVPGGVRAGAGRADRLGEGAVADRPDHAAAGATCSPLQTGVAAGFPGEPGDHRGGRAAADRTDHRGDRAAGPTQRPVAGADADRTATTTTGTGFLIDRIGAQTVWTQRVPVLVPGSWFAVDTAARARLGARFGAAVAADPHSVEDLAQRDDASAARAGRPDDAVCPGADQRVDQPQHRGHRSLGAGAGEQFGVILQCPGQAAALSGPGGDREHRVGRGRGGQVRVDGTDHLEEDLYRVTVLIGRAAVAAGSSLPVPRRDLADVPATDTPRGSGTADSAVPVLTAPLEGVQRLAAAGADGRRDSHRARPTQRDQQAPGDPGRRGTAVGEQPGTLGQRLGEAAPHVPAGSNGGQRPRPRRRASRPGSTW